MLISVWLVNFIRSCVCCI